ncbi:enolase-phosphatase E1-like isoform X2 [Pecten maximus]|uniref:enolase-phosphatase E1-like isoform X2 n=1 Tax=Pecten maximus TaxID=6579 RepID=UPI0014590802|nr:enolase-phosphatase E1-like isoform X2 [Pecten maximus]
MSKVQMNIDLLLPFVRRTFEKKPVTGDFQHYLKYVLAMRTVCDITNEYNNEENSEIHTLKIQTAKTIPAPKRFLDWLMSHNDSILDEMPVEDRRFKGSNVTRFILEEADNKLLSLLTDTLTNFDEKMEDQSSKKRNKSAKKKRKLEREMNGQEDMPDSELFFLDTGSSKQNDDTNTEDHVTKKNKISKKKRKASKEMEEEENTPDSELFFLDTGGSTQDQDSEMEEHVPKKKKKQKKKKESEETTGLEKQQGTQLFFLDTVGNQEKQATNKLKENQETEVYVIDTTKFQQNLDDIEIVDQEESDDSIEITDITIGEPAISSGDEEEIEANESDRRDMEEDESDVEGQSDASNTDNDEEQIKKTTEGNLVRNIGEAMDEDIVADDVDSVTDEEEKSGEEISDDECAEDDDEVDNSEDSVEDEEEKSGEEISDDECAEEDDEVDNSEGKSYQEQTEEMLATFVDKSPREVLEEDTGEREITLSTPEQKKPVPELPVSGRSTRQRQTSKNIVVTTGASQLSVKQQKGSGTPGIQESQTTSVLEKKQTPLSLRTRSSDKPSVMSPRKSTPGKGLSVVQPEITSPKKRSSVTSPGNTSPSKRSSVASLGNTSPSKRSSVASLGNTSPSKRSSVASLGNTSPSKRSSVDTPIVKSTKKQSSVDTPKLEKRLFTDVLEFTSEDIEDNVFSPKKQVKGVTPKKKGTGDMEVIDGSYSGETSVKTSTRKRRTELKTPDQSKQIDGATSRRKSNIKKDIFDFESDEEVILKTLGRKQKSETDRPETPKTESNRLKTQHTPKTEGDKFKTPKSVKEGNKSYSRSGKESVEILSNEVIPDSNDSDGESGEDFPLLNSPIKESCKVSSRSNKTSHSKKVVPTPDYTDTPRPQRTKRISTEKLTSLKSHNSLPSPVVDDVQHSSKQSRTNGRKSRTSASVDSDVDIDSGDTAVSALTAANLATKASPEKRYSLRATRQRRESGGSNVSNSSMVTRSRTSVSEDLESNLSQNKTKVSSRLQTLDEDNDSDNKVISIKETQIRSSKRKSMSSTNVELPRKSGRRFSLR